MARASEMRPAMAMPTCWSTTKTFCRYDDSSLELDRFRASRTTCVSLCQKVRQLAKRAPAPGPLSYLEAHRGTALLDRLHGVLDLVQTPLRAERGDVVVVLVAELGKWKNKKAREV